MSTAAQPVCTASAPAATKKRSADVSASATCKKAKAGQQASSPQQAQQVNMAQPFGWSYPPLPMLPFGPMMMPPFCPFPAMGIFNMMGGFPAMGMMGFSPLCQLPACTLPGNAAAAAPAPCDGSAGQGMQQIFAGAACSPSNVAVSAGGLYSGLTAPVPMAAAASRGFSAGRTSSDASGGFQSLSCSSSLPVLPAGSSDLVPRAASPDGNGSVCMPNASAATSEEDEEFASFIDTLFPSSEPSAQAAAEADGACMPRIDSLMNLLQADLELPSFC